jgi:hypothetical protein
MIKIFTSFLITSFLVTAFFCSCGDTAETSLASSVYHDDADGCDSPQGKADQAPKKHCDCNVTKITTADISVKTILTVPGGASQQPFILNSFPPYKNFDIKQNLSYLHGPPGPIAVVPLFIQFHSLRI